MLSVNKHKPTGYRNEADKEVRQCKACYEVVGARAQICIFDKGDDDESVCKYNGHSYGNMKDTPDYKRA